MSRASNDVKEAPHFIQYVADRKATAGAIKATGGGTLESEPDAFGDAGMTVGFAVDSAGNRMELIQLKEE